MHVVLASSSELKREVLSHWLSKRYGLAWSLQAIGTGNVTPAQPVNTAEECARIRLEHVDRIAEMYISIENGLEVKDNSVVDVCVVVVKTKEKEQVTKSFPIVVPYRFYNEAAQYPCKDGFEVTIGERIREAYPEVDKTNWMLNHRFGGIDRREQILDALDQIEI